MSIFKKNDNEKNYVGAEKHFTDVIKNSSSGGELLWLNPEEDFNTNSTLIVAESEEALFFKDGIIEQVFEGGKYTLSTNNYPFISRLRTAFSGGVSTFNCKVYFVRKAHSLEILWGTDTPIQVRDPKLKIMTSLQARGSYKIQIDDSKKFLVKMVGNNIENFEQTEVTKYFRTEFTQYIKSAIAKTVKNSTDEILGICAEQVELAKKLQIELQPIMGDYGIKIISFAIASIDIPENDPNRQKLENAYATKSESEIYGDDYNRFVGREILTDLANNSAGGIAAAGAGIGLGFGAVPSFGNAINQVFASTERGSENAKPSANAQCPSCKANITPGAKFCPNCGAEVVAKKQFCSSCGSELSVGAKFCSSCGEKQ